LNWQHQLCKNPRPNPDIKTLFVDHSCGQPNGARAPSPANMPLLGSLPKVGGFPPLGAHGVGHCTDLIYKELHNISSFDSYFGIELFSLYVYSHFNQLQHLCQCPWLVGCQILLLCPMLQSLEEELSALVLVDHQCPVPHYFAFCYLHFISTGAMISHIMFIVYNI
jgi:hypothetical protein